MRAHYFSSYFQTCNRQLPDCESRHQSVEVKLQSLVGQVWLILAGQSPVAGVLPHRLTSY